MGLKWTKNDPETLRANIEAYSREAEDAAIEALGEVVEQAEKDIKHIIEISVTPTGERRAAAGRGVAGRIEKGDMHKAVRGRVAKTGTHATGSFGWLEDGRGKDHASYQDPGTARIQGMNALFQSFVVATGDLKRKLAERGFKVQ